MTPTRLAKIEAVLDRRQSDLAFVIENVDDPHNVGAILRSCDAFGVLDVHLLYTNGKPPRLQELRSKSAASALKWLRITKWDSVKKMVVALRKEKKVIAVTHMGVKAKDVRNVDLTQSIALVVGNEHDGVSPELAKSADVNVLLPMVGFVQSFNVSVASALLMYEAFRQRNAKGMEGSSRLTKKDRIAILKTWMGRESIV